MIPLNQEFSDKFDILYNNITSNQAAGLDSYEKSVFLTKAQDELVKAYFDPKGNKYNEGFDGSQKRQVDFSMLINVINRPITSSEWNLFLGNSTAEASASKIVGGDDIVVNPDPGLKAVSFRGDIDPRAFKLNLHSQFNSKGGLFIILNEFLDVTRGTGDNTRNLRLSVIPITYFDYSRVMTKPYKRPTQYQAWRLMGDTTIGKSEERIQNYELLAGPNDTMTNYTIRFLRKPRPIILEDLTEESLTVNGESAESSCELDPIMYDDIIQRACELAKAAYSGDFNTQIAVGNASATNLGIVPQQQTK